MRQPLFYKILLLVLSTLVLSSCSSWKPTPWVKPHQRGLLADPIMASSNEPASTKYMNHVYEARESARGAEGGGGGGCGCN